MTSWWSAILIALAALAVPVLLHLQRRREARPQPWAAMRFVREAQRWTARQVRWRQRLLLAMRVLSVATLLLAVALPQPWARAALARLSGRAEPLTQPAARLHVVLLDLSLGMNSVEQGSPRFQIARQRLQQVLPEFAQPRDGGLLIAMEAQPHLVTPNPIRDRARLCELAEQLSPGHGPADLAGACRLAEDVLRERGDGKHCVVWLVSDGRAAAWSKEPVAGALRSLAESAAIHFIPVGQPAPWNAAVVDLAVDRDLVMTDEEVSITASIRGAGTPPATEGSLELRTWRVGDSNWGRPIARAVAWRPAAESLTIATTLRFDQPGLHVVECRLTPDDELVEDNVWTTLVEVHDEVAIGIVANGRDGERSGAKFLREALANPRFRARPRLLDVRQLLEAGMANLNVLHLCDLAEWPGELTPRLASFVDRGGLLVVWLGENGRPAFYNGLAGAWPGWRLGVLGRRSAPRGDAAGAFHLEVRPTPHAAIDPFRRWPETGPGGIALWEYWRLEARGEASARRLFDVVPGADQPPGAGRDAAVLEFAAGKGTAAAWAIAPDLHWTHWPLHGSFVPCVQGMVWEHFRQARRQRLWRVGQPATLPATSLARIATQRLHGPDGELLPLAAAGDGRPITFVPRRQGTYQLSSPSPMEEESTWFVASRSVDDVEAADPGLLDQAQLQSLCPTMAIHDRGASSALPSSAAAGWRMEWLVLLAAAWVALELVLLRWNDPQSVRLD